jgi:hypothetical protein
MSKSLHKTYCYLWFAGVLFFIIEPIMAFGLTDPQHHSKIAIIWVLGLIPLAMALMERKLSKIETTNWIGLTARIVAGVTLLACVLTVMSMFYLKGESGIIIELLFVPVCLLLTAISFVVDLVVLRQK